MRKLIELIIEAKNRPDLVNAIDVALVIEGQRITTGTYRVIIERVGPTADAKGEQQS